MKKPHKHAALIKAWADGAVIETFNKNAVHEVDRRWLLVGSSPLWNEAFEYRIKPEPPAREYPLSNMPWNKILEVLSGASLFSTVKIEREQARALVDAAIRHAIDHDQVVPMSEVQEVARNLAKRDRDARDMAVAQAVLVEISASCNDLIKKLFSRYGVTGEAVFTPNFAEIIASIKG